MQLGRRNLICKVCVAGRCYGARQNGTRPEDLQAVLKPEFRGSLESYEAPRAMESISGFAILTTLGLGQVALDATALLCEKRSSRQSLGFSEVSI